jgi:hypothetical protein
MPIINADYGIDVVAGAGSIIVGSRKIVSSRELTGFGLFQ